MATSYWLFLKEATSEPKAVIKPAEVDESGSELWQVAISRALSSALCGSIKPQHLFSLLMTGFSGNHPAITRLTLPPSPSRWAAIRSLGAYLPAGAACKASGHVCQCILCLTSSWRSELGAIKQAIDQMMLKVNCWAAEQATSRGSN